MENKHQQIRPHLTKEGRLPRCFKEVEKILRSVKSCQQNYKTILANSRLRGHIHRKVYSLTVNVLKHYSYIQKIMDKIQLLEKEKYLRKEIATVLIYDLIFGNGFLPGESKVVKTVQLYENHIFHAHKVLQNEVEDNLIIDLIPRYVRVHTLVTTVPYVIKDLTSYGFHQVIYDDKLSEEKYFELMKNLKKGSFLIDFHFKDILVFEHHENLVSLDLYKNGHIFLQDKSSYIPVHVLNPQQGNAVLDACAAPGMKTVHIAAKMKNKGILIACERDKNRFECLKGVLDCGSVKICKAICKDFKLIDPYDQAYSTMEYILLDPSCSGSGMVNRMDEVTDTENSKKTERLMKLAGFQIILLKHSLKFPAVKRVVYSTCSVHEEENEYVVHEALKAFSETFKLVPAMPEWSHRGSEKFEFGKLCLRTDPKVHLTNGFFVAVFERISFDDKYIGKYQKNYQVCDGSSFKKEKRNSSKSEDNWKTMKTEDYMEMNLKHEYNISHSEGSSQMNDDRQNYIQNADYELEQNVKYAEKINKKQKKREKSKESDKNKNNESSAQKANNELLQNIEYAQQINKKQKKKEKSNEYSCESEKNKNGENSAPSADYESEQNMEYSQWVNRKQKKKEKFNKESNLEFNECFKIKKHSNNSFFENDNSVNTYIEKSKYKYHKHSKKDLYENIEPLEEFTGVTKAHKKKKRKKEHFETEMLQSGRLHELESESGAVFTNKDAFAENKHLKNTSCEDSEDFISLTSSHKRNKKKKHLNIDYIQSCNKLKVDDISLSYEINDNVNKHKSVSNMSVSNALPESLVDSTFLHKQKKKHKKISVENDD